MHLIFTLIGILLTILFVVGTHEFGHFIVARLLGVRILRFSIGFGKVLLRFHDRQQTEYAFSLIPLGGYVKMLDESEGPIDPTEKHRAYNNQPFYKKFLIVLAGPFTNLLCALVLYWIIFMIGFYSVTPKIGAVSANSFASDAGLKKEQVFVAVDDRQTETWANVLFSLLARAGDEKNVKVVVKEPPPSAQTKTYYLNLSKWRIEGLTPDPLKDIGITPYQPQIPLIIGTIVKDSPAALSSLKTGDKIIAINDQRMKDWETVLNFIHHNPGADARFQIERKGINHTVLVKLGTKTDWYFHQTGVLGIRPAMKLPKDFFHLIKYSPIPGLQAAWDEVKNITTVNLLLFKKLVTGDLSIETLGGPITIFESAGSAFMIGVVAFINFLAFLSISIGVINLFPVPGLDGGHLVIQAIEAFMKKPLPEKILLNLYRVGFLLIFFIILQAMINDVLRLFNLTST